MPRQTRPRFRGRTQSQSIVRATGCTPRDALRREQRNAQNVSVRLSPGRSVYSCSASDARTRSHCVRVWFDTSTNFHINPLIKSLCPPTATLTHFHRLAHAFRTGLMLCCWSRHIVNLFAHNCMYSFYLYRMICGPVEMCICFEHAVCCVCTCSCYEPIFTLASHENRQTLTHTHTHMYVSLYSRSRNQSNRKFVQLPCEHVDANHCFLFAFPVTFCYNPTKTQSSFPY